jgi:hypothetical protein
VAIEEGISDAPGKELASLRLLVGKARVLHGYDGSSSHHGSSCSMRPLTGLTVGQRQAAFRRMVSRSTLLDRLRCVHCRHGLSSSFGTHSAVSVSSPMHGPRRWPKPESAMRGLGSRRVVIGVGALTLACSTMLLQPAEAQYGGGGYGGGYDRSRQSDEEMIDRRRGARDNYDEPRRGGREDGPRGGGGSGAQARGSFVQSCRDIDQDGAYLSAACRMRGGGYSRSRIDTRSCRSIGNNNGRLVCE